MKVAIAYSSTHHGNTKKLLDAIAEKHEVTLIDVTKKQEYELNDYDFIGFASGIYGFGIAKEIISFASINLPDHKNVFYIFTSAIVKELKLKELGDLFRTRDANFLGSYHAYGHITWGPFALGGGSRKGHPTKKEIAGAVRFFEKITKAGE